MMRNKSDEYIGVESAIRCEITKARLSLDMMSCATDIDGALEGYSKLCKSSSNIFELKKSELWLKKLCNDVEGD